MFFPARGLFFFKRTERFPYRNSLFAKNFVERHFERKKSKEFSEWNWEKIILTSIRIRFWNGRWILFEIKSFMLFKYFLMRAKFVPENLLGLVPRKCLKFWALKQERIKQKNYESGNSMKISSSKSECLIFLKRLKNFKISLLWFSWKLLNLFAQKTTLKIFLEYILNSKNFDAWVCIFLFFELNFSVNCRSVWFSCLIKMNFCCNGGILKWKAEKKMLRIEFEKYHFLGFWKMRKNEFYDLQCQNV